MFKYIPKYKFSQSASAHANANTGTFCGVPIKQDQIDRYLRTFFNASFSKNKPSHVSIVPHMRIKCYTL